jgi:hypothetical protein
MPDKQLDIINKELHPDAKVLARSFVDSFANTLLLEAKNIAYKRKDEIVLKNHVSEAFDHIQKKKERDWVKQLALIFGGAFIGAGVPGFITELMSDHTVGVAAYAIIGLAGVLISFAALYKQ